MLLRNHPRCVAVIIVGCTTGLGMLDPALALSQSVELGIQSGSTSPVAQATTVPSPSEKTPTQEDPPDSLEITKPDPLLPRIPVKRPLTVLERRSLTEALDKLEAEANVAREQGDLATAFKIWNRTLRLRRFLGVISEVRALGQIGNIAWEETQPIQVRLIRNRLQAIQEQYLPSLTQRSTALPQLPESEQIEPDPALMLPQLPKDPVDLVLLQRALGIAYQQIRSRPLALAVYEQQLAQARQQGDRTLEQATLIIIGGLHFNWFDYPNAVQTYRQLLPLAPITVTTPPVKRSDDQALEDPPLLTKAEILRRIIYMQEQDRQWLAAIAAQDELMALAQSQKQTDLLPGLQLAIARNYRALGDVDAAIANYRQAYLLAQPLQQFGYASDALKEAAELYKANNQPQKAIEIYQFLLEVDQQAYNTYGRMMTYDQIGQLYQQQGDTTRAVRAFQQGLALARQLKYREDYFLQQIEAVRNPSPKSSNPTPSGLSSRSEHG